jgi:hypothetical protein
VRGSGHGVLQVEKHLVGRQPASSPSTAAR